jgi:SAM-dependent methyltransferase
MENDIATTQSLDELEDWHRKNDPWGYESNKDDVLRKAILLSELPQRSYQRVLDVGCGQGFVTRDLPGNEIIGVDVSSEAIRKATTLYASERIRFTEASIFDFPEQISGSFDLIVVTGVLYPQYIGRALSIVYRNVNRLLADDGVLLSVHIDEWYQARFPLLRLREHFYPYREYTHRLELYVK